MNGQDPAVQRRRRHGAIRPANDDRPAASTADRLQIAFGLVVLAFFAAQLLRGAIQQGWF